MPQTRKLAWAQLRVGVMTLAAIAILTVLVFLLTGRGAWFRSMARIRTYVDDAASLNLGAPVKLNGIAIGNVGAVRITGETDPRRTIEIALDVPRADLGRIPVDSQSAIRPEGVFGDKYVNITRGKSPTAVADGGEIASLDTRDFPEIVDESYRVMASLQGITKRIDSITSQVEQGRGTIGKLLYDDGLYNRIDGVVERAQNVVDQAASGKGTIGKLLSDDALYEQARTTMRRVDTVVADVEAGKGTLGMLLHDPALYQNASRVVAEANKVVDGVNAGQGTLGKLIKDEALHKQVVALLNDVDRTLDRMNSGQGTIGQLLVNRALYDNVTGMSGEARSLIQEIRTNPKKFLRIKLGLF
jgi:phospholipid/cholesterol/gamma-HCH transport system substrate-binding protein